MMADCNFNDRISRMTLIVFERGSTIHVQIDEELLFVYDLNFNEITNHIKRLATVLDRMIE